MQTTRSHSRHKAAVFGLAATALLSSCSLPPREAWRQIRQDGLITFMANGMSAPKGVTPDSPSSQTLLASSGSPTSTKVVEPAPPRVQPVAPHSPFPLAYAVNGLTGYVRTPHTNPPRLVDVRDMRPGTRVVCPYTQKPFIVPNAAATPSAKPSPGMLASSQAKPAPKPAPSPSLKPQQPAPAVKPRENAGPAKLAASTPAPAPAPAPAPVKPTPAPAAPKKTEPAPIAKTEPKKEQPAPAVSSTPTEPTPRIEPKKEPAPAPQTAAAPKLPFGSPIPGRPGFVNSPFAEKHQLVDVTGLSVGTEVKCPYTGRLFRVPPQAQAKR